MTPREIITDAWHITQKQRKVLLPWGALDAFVLLIGAMLFVSYQTYVLSVFFRTGVTPSWQDVFAIVWAFVQGKPFLVVSIITTAIIYVLLWIFIPRFATAALIGLAAKIRNNDEPKGGLVIGVFNFLPLVELAAALGAIGAKTLFSVWSLVVRYMTGIEGIFSTAVILLVFWAVSFVFHFLFTFAEEAVVIRKVGIFSALGQSFKMVLSYLSKVVLIAVLLLIIMLRIVVNALIIFIIPSVVMGLGLFLARFFPEIVSFGISGGIGLICIGFASYFLGYVTVFKHTVWTITYLELLKEKELDVIETEGDEASVSSEEVIEDEKQVGM